MDALVSIIVPVFNTQLYLIECIESLIYQSYKNIEIIIIDDGSVDNSCKIVQEYADKDSRIIFMKKSHNGVGIARNIALTKVKGEYITFVDSDDYLNQDTISKCLSAIKKNHSDVCIYNGESFDDITYNTIKKEYFSLKKHYFSDGTIKEEYRSKIFNCHSSCMKFYLFSFLKNNGIKFPENILGEDVEFWVRCLLLTNKITYSDHKGYYRRVCKNSIMTSNTCRNVTDRINNIPILLDLSKNDEKLFQYIFFSYVTFVLLLANENGESVLIQLIKDFLTTLKKDYILKNN